MSRRHAALDWRLWAAVRRRALRRDGHRCCACGAAGRLEVDHIVPLAKLDKGGAPYELANLQSLCRRCHFAKTERENPGNPERRAWRAYMRRSLAAG